MNSHEIGALQAEVVPIVLALPRLLAAFLVLPYFAGTALGGAVRGAFVLVLAAFVAPAVPVTALPGAGPWLVIVCKETLIGLLLGLGFGVFVWALQCVGELIDFQSGTANAAFFDPIAGHEIGPTGDLLFRLAVTLFVSAGGLLGLIGALFESYQLWPVASYFPDARAVLQAFAVREGDAILAWITKLAAPVIFVLVLVDLGVGLVGRVAPQLNVFVVAQPLKGLLAILVLALVLHIVYAGLQDFLRPDNSVLQFLRHVL
ncbi:type III secretion system export apparatus subunit SctT [Aquincola sp. S2]|uniref:Type III secretion system export apparatus subunit SctT n=1 Tax=Pseudaquabacterium terrae TaxID=2732868 RepID=A0ABX2EL78_9BURK|nr:type III secretion system export apparatus subunit SctT [Aquabacterium terrae]NRF69409.1 type III secretion system export apparatus subunit SctT [Aquabacterium terrae]